MNGSTAKLVLVDKLALLDATEAALMIAKVFLAVVSGDPAEIDKTAERVALYRTHEGTPETLDKLAHGFRLLACALERQAVAVAEAMAER